MDYGFEHAGKVFTPNGTPGIAPAENDARNRELEARELAHWAEQPERMVAYYRIPDVIRNSQNRIVSWSTTDAVITTWRGTVLGKITSVSLYRHNFGGWFVAIRARGTNGAMYAGRASWDWGDVINLRKVKG